jgi:cytochrome c
MKHPFVAEDGPEPLLRGKIITLRRASVMALMRRRRSAHNPPLLAQPHQSETLAMKNKTGALAGIALWALAAGPAMAAADGHQMFQRYCYICHSTEAGQNKVGPSLAGVVGRAAGTEADFNYSDAMRSAHKTWDETTLDQYLTDPKATVPGNKMLFIGIKNPDERHAIIDYLKSLKS